MPFLFLPLHPQAVDQAEASNLVQKRTKNIENTFLYSIYRNVCRSLFEKDKLLFSFLLCTRIKQARKEVDPAEWQALLTMGNMVPGGWLLIHTLLCKPHFTFPCNAVSTTLTLLLLYFSSLCVSFFFFSFFFSALRYRASQPRSAVA